MEFKEIEKLYNKYASVTPDRIEKLPGAGSSRDYYRVYAPGGQTVIATRSKEGPDNYAFRHLSDVFCKEGIRVPEILMFDESLPELYLQSDHGDLSLMDLITDHQKAEASIDSDGGQIRGSYEEVIRRLKQAVIELVKMQTIDFVKIDKSKVYAPFSRRQIMWDLNYFKYDFVKPSGIEFDESTLEDDFELLARRLSEIPESLTGFMYRDFQSRNIMVEPEGVTLIDFQGGRRGPVIYDMVSLLWQAKARFTKKLREEMVGFYLDEYSRAVGQDVREEAIRELPLIILFRTLQVLGAYGFRGLIEKKAHFIDSIPFGLDNLRELIDEGALREYPELERCCRQLVAQRAKYSRPKSSGLRVEVFSFSYKRGYPADFSGNGGGFMFDCRGMHNPGRYEEYKRLTGLDRPVIDFLEERGEVQRFLDAVHQLVGPAVECYRRRGFTNLQVGFGCTGGRHRSVYCAQHMAEWLAERFPDVGIILMHREQGIRKTYNRGDDAPAI